MSTCTYSPEGLTEQCGEEGAYVLSLFEEDWPTATVIRTACEDHVDTMAFQDLLRPGVIRVSASPIAGRGVVCAHGHPHPMGCQECDLSFECMWAEGGRCSCDAG